MTIFQLAVAALPTLLKDEIMKAHLAKRAPNYAAVAEECFMVAKALVLEHAQYQPHIVERDINQSKIVPKCVNGYKRHFGVNGTCMRCGKLYTPGKKPNHEKITAVSQ